VGCRDRDDKIGLWKTQDIGVARVAETAFVGTGQVVAAYVCERLFRNRPSTAVTHHLATQIMREVKMTGAYVGGNTEIWSVVRTGADPFFEVTSPNDQPLWSMEHYLASAIRCAFNGRRPQVEARLTAIRNKLENIITDVSNPFASQGKSWRTLEVARPDTNPFLDL
jgi:hypothetical protein